MRENLRLVSSQEASAIKGRPHAIPSGYLGADVRGDGPAANMAAPENSRAEIAGRAAAMQLELAEWPQGKQNFPKERYMPETAPNDQQSKADGSQIP